MKNKILKRLPSAEKFSIDNIITIKPHQVMSLTAYANKGDSFLLFAYDKEEGVSREILQEDSLYVVIEGKVELTIETTTVALTAGESIVVSAEVGHAIVALEPSKVLAIHVSDT